MKQNKKSTKLRIIDFVRENNEVSAKDIIRFLEITEAAVFRHLKALVESDVLSKSGKTPKVFYFIPEKKKISSIILPEKAQTVIKNNFINITASGELLEGVDAFLKWCSDRKFDPIKYSMDYVEIFEKYNRHKRNGFINGTNKMRTSFSKLFLDKAYYLDFYSIERFGKTKLGILLLYAKQTQNMNLIDKIYEMVKDDIINFIRIKKINAVGFIPATISREVQFQKELERKLNINLPIINLVKTKNMIAVPQKSLSKLADRIENARKTIFVDENRSFDNVLLIDDAVGSGATLNETARKSRYKKIVRNKIYGLALTGSFKGFDVISEL